MTPSPKTKQIHVASFNVTGIHRAGKREEIEEWMVENKIELLALPEHMLTDKDRNGKAETLIRRNTRILIDDNCDICTGSARNTVS